MFIARVILTFLFGALVSFVVGVLLYAASSALKSFEGKLRQTLGAVLGILVIYLIGAVVISALGGYDDFIVLFR